jgi:hypothetical protein
VITRIVVIDPCPRDPRDDVIVYQVPEKSRAHELLMEMLESQRLEHVELTSPKRRKSRGEPA